MVNHLALPLTITELLPIFPFFLIKMSTICPNSIPRFDAVGRKTVTRADLAEMEFITHCPPDVPPKSRILGLCGITDWKNLASPQDDGWLFSDFYLFHHLLSPPGKSVLFTLRVPHRQCSGLTLSETAQIHHHLPSAG
jgi:hypothetical protein